MSQSTCQLERPNTMENTMNQNRRLVIVSNREPYSIKIKDELISLEKTPGGLISALEPMLKERGGIWICWEGAQKRVEEFDSLNELEAYSHNVDHSYFDLPYDIRTVALSENEINHYYYGYANTRLWPLFHYFVSKCNFMDERDWPNYVSANQKFADAVLENTTDEDDIWIQDYHMFLVPNMVRQQEANRRLGFFCHIPFPHYEILRTLPRANKILEGMLGSDIIGFHTPEYVNYFLHAVSKMLTSKKVSVDFENQTVTYKGRQVKVQDFPIGIDNDKIVRLAQRPDMPEKAKILRASHDIEYMGIGIDRLDYSKGIFERLEAIRLFFEKYPEYCKRLTFIQIAAPTRTEVDSYREMKEQVEQTVGSINGQFSQDGWVPIHYFYRGFSLEELVPYLIASDFALITPIRDGMNLVAKEYCAAKVDNTGVLILSELAGVSSQLTQALQVNPFFTESVADTIHAALTLPDDNKAARMQQLRDTIAGYDIHHWVEAFLEAFDNVVEQR